MRTVSRGAAVTLAVLLAVVGEPARADMDVLPIGASEDEADVAAGVSLRPAADSARARARRLVDPLVGDRAPPAPPQRSSRLGAGRCGLLRSVRVHAEQGQDAAGRDRHLGWRSRRLPTGGESASPGPPREPDLEPRRVGVADRRAVLRSAPRRDDAAPGRRLRPALRPHADRAAAPGSQDGECGPALRRPVGSDDRLYRDRTGFGGEIRFRPQRAFGAGWDGLEPLGPELSLRGGWQHRDATTQLRFHRDPTNTWFGVPAIWTATSRASAGGS